MSNDAILKQINVGLDRANIYRVLNRFCQDLIVHNIVADDGKKHFEVCLHYDKNTIKHNHFHFRCTKCETIECIPTLVEITLLYSYVANKMNYLLIEICKDCK